MFTLDFWAVRPFWVYNLLSYCEWGSFPDYYSIIQNIQNRIKPVCVFKQYRLCWGPEMERVYC